MYFGTDGWWRCAVKKRAWERKRYDTDPVHRIEKLLHDRARARADTLKRKKEALRGPLPE